jgi:NADH pyrophosphatase NudC (nudix superfamily)
MVLKELKKVRDGKYLKNYELIYENKLGKEKKYEIVSRRDLKSVKDLGAAPSGVSILATCGDKMLLLHEFRMGVNKLVYNLCAGMLEEGETIEQCIARELYEETGLKLKKIKKILPPSYAALAISDVTTYIAIVEIEEGICSEDNTSSNEEIKASLYTRDEVKNLLETESFSSRAQLAAYFFAYGNQLL